jgi:hypothetical protein
MPRTVTNNALTPVREVDELVRLHDEIVAEAKISLQKAIRMGELLVSIKGTMPHGSWQTWCSDTLPRISDRSIRNYMRVFNNKDTLLRQEITDPAAAYKALTVPKRQPLPVSPAVTAGAMRAAVSNDGPTVVLDGMGFPIPAHALVYWGRTAEAAGLLQALHMTKRFIETALEAKDKMYLEVNFPSFLADIANAHSHLTVAIPFAVCPTCAGNARTPACTTCRGRGLVSEYYWKHKVPKETKEIRYKAVELMKERNKR